MKEFDVVFLLLSTMASRRFDQFLNLYGALANAGFHTALATHPADLNKPCQRLRIVIIDGNEDSEEFDPFAVTRALRRQHGANQCIVFVADTTFDAFERGREVGADICVGGTMNGLALRYVLDQLANQHVQKTALERRTSAAIPVAGHEVQPAASRYVDRATVMATRHKPNAMKAYRARTKRKQDERKIAKRKTRAISSREQNNASWRDK